MQATFTRNIAMSDMFRALAGAPDAQFDMISCAVYTAAYHIMESGNKTQFVKLDADASMYGTSSDALKNVKALFGVKTVNATVRHFQRTYYAVSEALRQCGVPADMQKELPAGKAHAAARAVILEPLAQDYADQFTAIFTSIMSMPEKTEEERTAAAAAREAKKAEKEALAAKQARAAERAARQDAERVARLELEVEHANDADTMARTVADMLRAGTLSAELEALLIEAAQVRETAALLRTVAEPVAA